MRNQASQRLYVTLTIFENVLPLPAGKRRALHNAITHVVLVGDVKLVLAKITQRTGNRIKPLVAVFSFSSAVVHVVTKFDIGIERACRLAPAKCDVRAEFGTDHVADDQCIGVEAVWRKWTE